MGLINIEGKEITLDDAIIDAGMPAIRAALSVDFPDVENADINIVRPVTPDSPRVATVVKRGTGKGQGEALPAVDPTREVLAVLLAAPEYVNPAIALAAQVMRTEARGETVVLDGSRIERAVAIGEREGRAVTKALKSCGHSFPIASRKVPTGF
jgi:hypothetical protein